MKTDIVVQSGPMALLELAISKDADIDKLEKLMELKERLDRNEASKAFKRAIVEFQGNKPELRKTKGVFMKGEYRFSFIPLPKIQKAIDPVLSKADVSYRWEQAENDDRITITCIVSHVDGHEERTSMSSDRDGSGSKNTIQSIGSAVSYLKRYTLEGALGLSADEDTDGNVEEQIEDLIPKKEELTPKHKMWKVVKAAISNNTRTMAQLKEKYKVSESNEKLLLKS